MTLTGVSTTKAEVIMMTSAQVVETSVSVMTNSPSLVYTHPDDHASPTYNRILIWIKNEHFLVVSLAPPPQTIVITPAKQTQTIQ